MRAEGWSGGDGRPPGEKSKLGVEMKGGEYSSQELLRWIMVPGPQLHTEAGEGQSQR